MKSFKILSLLLCSFLLTSCIPYDFSKRIIKQGNLLPPAKIETLKIGMDKEQAGIIMGTSMLSPMFNTNRWDYAYTWRCGTGKMIVRNLTICFKNDKIIRIEHHP